MRRVGTAGAKRSPLPIVREKFTSRRWCKTAWRCLPACAISALTRLRSRSGSAAGLPRCTFHPRAVAHHTARARAAPESGSSRAPVRSFPRQFHSCRGPAARFCIACGGGKIRRYECTERTRNTPIQTHRVLHTIRLDRRSGKVSLMFGRIKTSDGAQSVANLPHALVNRHLGGWKIAVLLVAQNAVCSTSASDQQMGGIP